MTKPQIKSLAHSILFRPAPSSDLILAAISLVHVCNLWDQWIIWVRVSQQRTDGKQYLKGRKHEKIIM